MILATLRAQDNENSMDGTASCEASQAESDRSQQPHKSMKYRKRKADELLDGEDESLEV
jgi:hypothetical protein